MVPCLLEARREIHRFAEHSDRDTVPCAEITESNRADMKSNPDVEIESLAADCLANCIDDRIGAIENIFWYRAFALSSIYKPIRHDAVADDFIDCSARSPNEIDLNCRQSPGNGCDFLWSLAGGPRTEIRDIAEKHDCRAVLNWAAAVICPKLDNTECVAVGEAQKERFGFVNGLPKVGSAGGCLFEC